MSMYWILKEVSGSDIIDAVVHYCNSLFSSSNFSCKEFLRRWNFCADGIGRKKFLQVTCTCIVVCTCIMLYNYIHEIIFIKIILRAFSAHDNIFATKIIELSCTVYCIYMHRSCLWSFDGRSYGLHLFIWHQWEINKSRWLCSCRCSGHGRWGHPYHIHFCHCVWANGTDHAHPTRHG